MQKLHKLFQPNRTSQSQPIDNKQVKNTAGGYVWEINVWQRLDRFLILGTEGGTYYINEQKLTTENAQNAISLLKDDGKKVIQRTVKVSEQGRAYKNDPALFILALAFTVGDDETKNAAAGALTKVARTGTHLFTFMTYVNEMRGWGRGLRRAVANWYQVKDLGKLAYQVTKYQQRNGWSHRDALRLSHPKTNDSARDALYQYITGKQEKLKDISGDWVSYLKAVETMKSVSKTDEVIEAIKNYGLPREVIPTEMLNKPEVWEMLLEKMPMTAMIRNLATMTKVGLLAPMSAAASIIAERLTDEIRLQKARIHPIQILAALMTYQSGKGARGKGTWTPVQSIVDALDKAFYMTFKNVEPTQKRIMLALDVSGSMTWGAVGGVPNLTPCVASAALALVTAAKEPKHVITAFSHKMTDINISPRQRLDDVIKTTSDLPFGATDCALPMQYALKQELEIDAFVILTDNETWYGKQHPAEALNEYRRKVNAFAKLAVVGMVSNGFSIANPNDGGMLDFVGFSTNTPNAIGDFIRE